MAGMFLTPLLNLFGGYWFPPEALTGPPAPEPAPEPAAVEEPPRPDVPTLAEAVAVLRKEVRDTKALQPRKATAPPLIVIASYIELDLVLSHVEAQLREEAAP
jgi:hypothetical protein